MAMRAVMGTPGSSEAAQRKRVPRIGDKGIDIVARRVYVHHKPNADGSNPRSGKPAERRRFGRKSRLSAFCFMRTPDEALPYRGRPDRFSLGLIRGPRRR